MSELNFNQPNYNHIPRQGCKFQDIKTGDVMEIGKIEYFAGFNEMDRINYNWITGNHRPMDGYYMTREQFEHEADSGILVEVD